MKRLCVLAMRLTSSLAGAAGNVAANLEGQYYSGLNFDAGWGGGFVMKPSVVFGYYHDKNFKFELEVLSNINNIASEGMVVGTSLLENYRFYPDLDIDPVKLYVSRGLGGYVKILTPFGFGGGSVSATSVGGGDETGGGDIGNNAEDFDNAEVG
ncbi:hypothetical protein IHO40_02700 [Wolbachia endosymbiont of Mansonella ozzardi]|uniref:hypothetical protein n=1 Tax=Wolbachia endosymbiont of Mansonella ozzardi TaxID=137464 RepID=UPI001CE04645|nr:hypothetical protein [Wolbachia endosymbiont of Mansonella ozzardi]MCA4775022.1 hypothetical protein [Wolbachia endosymbiont of Mansonella ozzardi]